MSYYSRHRDECLAYAAMKRAAYTDEEKAKHNEYYKQYWGLNAKFICEKMINKRRIAREKREAAVMATPVLPLNPPAEKVLPLSPPTVVASPSVIPEKATEISIKANEEVKQMKKQRVRKSTAIKIPVVDTPEPFGFENLSTTQKNVFKGIAPLGYCEKRLDANPFLMTFK